MQSADVDPYATLNPQAREVLTFWYGAPDSPTFGQSRTVWFKKDSAFDQQVRERFLPVHQAAATGTLDPWRSTPRGCLALAIVLDQFPRNMFRDTPQAFASDAQALAVASQAVDAQFDQGLLPVERMFLYLPFEHSEDLVQQRHSLELFSGLAVYPDMANIIDYARRHHEIIARFGRFPHRNRILGRASTPQELDYLSQPGSGF